MAHFRSQKISSVDEWDIMEQRSEINRLNLEAESSHKKIKWKDENLNIKSISLREKDEYIIELQKRIMDQGDNIESDPDPNDEEDQ